MDEFINAQEMGKKNPDTFDALSIKELDKVEVGDIVKVAVGRERFWTKVTKREGGRIWATVDNDLLFTEEHGLKYADEITFNMYNIYNIYED